MPDPRAVPGVSPTPPGRPPATRPPGGQPIHPPVPDDPASDDPAAVVATLDAAVPVVLLPVRLETRFRTAPGSPGELRLRIYPDDLGADTHDPRLTEEEVRLGRDYWASGWVPDDEPQAWRALLSQVPAPRAAWIVRATEPANLRERPLGSPAFGPPAAPLRSPASSRAARAALLPDRWVVFCLRAGTVVQRVVSAPVRRDLALGLSVGPDGGEPGGGGTAGRAGGGARQTSGDPGPALGPALDWTVRFEEAVAAGMAVRIPLDATSRAGGYDRVIVLGIRSGSSPDAAAGQLASLLDSHRYSRGVGLVSPGSPTTNVPGNRTEYPPDDPDGSVSFDAERRAATPAAGSDGARVMRALGLPASASTHLVGAGTATDADVRAVHETLWPVSLGYFLGELMAPVVPENVLRDAAEHFGTYVRPGGPLPALRVGGLPYGLLPVTSLARWQPDPDAGPAARVLPPVLRRLLPVWQAQIGAVPRVGRGDDPEADLIAVLGLDASSRTVRVRGVRGRDLQFSQRLLDRLEWAGYSAAQQAIARRALTQLGVGGWNPRLAGMVFEELAPAADVPLVADVDGTGTQISPAGYLRWLRTATVEALRTETFPSGTVRPRALLYRLLRHSLLLAYADAALEVMTRHGLATPEDRGEPELVGFEPEHLRRRTVWQRFTTRVPAGGGTVADELDRALTGQRPGSGAAATPDALPKALQRILKALARLETMPVGTLERLTGELLDTCSHRIDPWVTSLAAARLERMRERRPTGSHLGAYGWLVDVRPVTPTGEPVAGPGTAARPRSGEYVHAPSMRHAATSAVLRNAYLSSSLQGGDPGRYAVDLTSARVREALDLLDAVRGGQSVGAVLGRRFEQNLRERVPASRQLPYLSALRTLYPTATTHPPATGVVHGLLLRDAWAAGQVPFGRGGLPAAGPDRAAIEAAAADLDAATDAVADLLLAESVHQLVGGNTAGATASLDALGRGTRPPDPEIARTPQGGTAVVHRVILDLGVPAPGGTDPSRPAAGWPADGPRAQAEPALARWAGELLGDPRAVRAEVTVRTPDHDSTQTITLADLGLDPLDVVALAAQGTSPQPSPELQQRITAAAARRAGATGEFSIRYEGDDSAPAKRTIPQLLALARAVHTVTRTGRPLGPTDLGPPGATAQADDARAAEALARANAALAALDAARGRLEAVAVALGGGTPGGGAPAGGAPAGGAPALVDDLVATLTEVSRFGIACYPPAHATHQQLRDLATTAARELRSRSVTAASARPGPGASAADTLDRATAMVKAVFGGDFVLLPRVRVSAAAAPAGAAGLRPSDGLLGGDVHAPHRWLTQAAQVRPSLAQWARMLRYARALGAPVPAAEVDQLPRLPGARWAALPFGGSQDRPPNGCLSMVTYRRPLGAHRPSTGSADRCGLLLDEWTDTIPDPTVDTGLALHVDGPTAQAPQVVLVVVPPEQTTRWDLDSVVAAVGETLDLTTTRAVDGRLLGALAQYLPGLYLSANAAGDTVSTAFADVLVDETPITTED